MITIEDNKLILNPERTLYERKERMTFDVIDYLICPSKHCKKIIFCLFKTDEEIPVWEYEEKCHSYYGSTLRSKKDSEYIHSFSPSGGQGFMMEDTSDNSCHSGIIIVDQPLEDKLNSYGNYPAVTSINTDLIPFKGNDQEERYTELKKYPKNVQESIINNDKNSVSPWMEKIKTYAGGFVLRAGSLPGYRIKDKYDNKKKICQVLSFRDAAIMAIKNQSTYYIRSQALENISLYEEEVKEKYDDYEDYDEQ